MILAYFFVILGGISHATFGLGQKRFEPLSWESFWLPFAFVSMIIIPLIWAFTIGSEVWRIMSVIPVRVFLIAVFFGSCWGLAAILWGKALIWIGMSLTYGIVLSITMATGSLVPMLRVEEIGQSPSLPFIFIGTVIMLGGVAMVTLSGIRRDQLQIKERKQIKGVESGRLFKIGLLIAFFSGLLGALQNIGYSEAQRVALQNGRDSAANLVSWLIVFIGGFLVQGGYSLHLLIKNKSYITYRVKPIWKSVLKIIITSLFWFAALAFYGQGATKMGELGTSIGWTMFLSLSLVISNIYAYLSGEWKGASKPLKILIMGNSLLIFSWIVLGYANSLV